MPTDKLGPHRDGVSGIETRVATVSDLDGLVDTLTRGFTRDPVWSWAFPNPRDLGVWWQFLISSALRYPEVWVTGEYAAVSVWIPPAGTELTEEEEGGVESLLEDLIGARASSVISLLDRFETSHPRQQPHYYLSLLGVHPDHRGKGLGMALLAENLRRLDAMNAPAYLESSNPANDRRYERLGFRRVGAFTTPDGSNTVATMWRNADVPGTTRAAGTPSGNTGIVAAAYAALARAGLDGFIQHWTDDLDHRAIEGGPDDCGPIRGRDAFRHYIQDWMDTFDEFMIEPVELIEAGDDTVVGVLRYGGRARLSGLKIDETFGVVLTIRAGRIAGGREFSTRDEAVRAAGLSPQELS